MLSVPDQVYFLGQIVLAMFLGGVIGLQRERSGKSAGPRTYALVTAGAALVTIVAMNVNSPTIIGQIVAGIGFLGVGTILHRNDTNHVEGLTTAAGLWMAAMLGIAIGTRYFVLAIGSTVLVLILLMFNDSRFRNQQIK